MILIWQGNRDPLTQSPQQRGPSQRTHHFMPTSVCHSHKMDLERVTQTMAHVHVMNIIWHNGKIIPPHPIINERIKQSFLCFNICQSPSVIMCCDPNHKTVRAATHYYSRAWPKNVISSLLYTYKETKLSCFSLFKEKKKAKVRM